MPNSDADPSPTRTRRRSFWPYPLLLSLLLPVIAAILAYQLDSFEPGHLPLHELAPHPVAAPRRNERMLLGAERVGEELLLGPEDIALDSEKGVIYTGTADGWIKLFSLNNSEVSEWVNTGGRPLGLVLCKGRNQVLVADADKGLLSITEDGKIELLTDGAEGLKFKLTDGVDVTEDGMIYFTDASYKYSLKEFILDVLEGKPHGRLLSFDPKTKETKVLVDKLYFANGVAIAPNQDFVIYCETVMKRCRRYYLKGPKKGRVGNFINRLPGTPDNIKYDGHGHFWIALATETTAFWNFALEHPMIRKWMALIERSIGRPHMEKNGGVFVVDLEGNPVAHYYDVDLSMVSSGVKIGNHLYCGSVVAPYLLRLNLDEYPATEII